MDVRGTCLQGIEVPATVSLAIAVILLLLLLLLFLLFLLFSPAAAATYSQRRVVLPLT